MGLLRKIIGYVRTDIDIRRRPATRSPEMREAMADLDDVDHKSRVRDRQFSTSPEREPAADSTRADRAGGGGARPDDGPGLDDLRRITDR